MIRFFYQRNHSNSYLANVPDLGEYPNYARSNFANFTVFRVSRVDLVLSVDRCDGNVEVAIDLARAEC